MHLARPCGERPWLGQEDVFVQINRAGILQNDVGGSTGLETRRLVEWVVEQGARKGVNKTHLVAMFA